MSESVRHPRLPGLAFVIFGLLSTRTVGAQQTRPQGVWHLDETRSDSSPAQFGQRSDSGSPWAGPRGRGPGPEGPGAEGPGVRRAPGGYGGRRGPKLDQTGIARIRQTLELLRHAPRQIRIAGDSTITFDVGSGTETSWRIGGKPVTEKVEDGGDLETKVRWKDEALVVERKVAGGGRVTESYELGLGATRLIVFVAVDGLWQPLARTRQYLPADSGTRDKE